MTNPFQKSADALVEGLAEIAGERDRARQAAEAKRREEERSFERATACFAAVAAKVEECLAQANEAFHGNAVTLASKVVPISSTAGAITVTLSGEGMAPASFRIVGNASFKLYVHELADPKYGPFDLADAEALPYGEMVEQLIRNATAKLRERAGGEAGDRGQGR